MMTNLATFPTDPDDELGNLFSTEALAGSCTLEKSDFLHRLVVFKSMSIIVDYFPELKNAYGDLTLPKTDFINRLRAMGFDDAEWIASNFFDVLTTDDKLRRDFQRKRFP